jgi:hypothetical protein
MNIRQIVEAHLKKVGAAGLCDDSDCRCPLSDLAWCGKFEEVCVPAVRRKCVPKCEVCGGSGCLVPMPDEPEKKTKS